jgi:predicted peroxiredoxin
MSMAKEKLVILATHAADDPERATVPFVMANAAMATEMNVTIVLQFEGVRVAVVDHAKNINAEAFPPLQDLMNDFFAMGGVLMACTPCLKARKIQESHLIPGTRLVAAGTVVAEVASANKTLVY